MTEAAKQMSELSPEQWYQECGVGFWDVFDIDHFTPTLDGFMELTVDESMFAETKGVYLNRPRLASYLLNWWRSTTLVA